jgi:hypothetical protein
MKKGLTQENVSLTLIRKYCRLVKACYIAYLDGKDVIQAVSWIKKHWSHRGHLGAMDDKLYKLYFPYVTTQLGNGGVRALEKLREHNIKGSEEREIIGDAVAIIDVRSVEEG